VALAAWLLIAVVTLLLLEVISRVFVADPVEFVRLSNDPELVYELKPGRYLANGVLFRIPAYTININQQGCRDRPLGADDFQQQVTRVLFVGDSFSFGEGVNDEQVFSRLLEENYNAGHGPARFRVINCGVEGYNLVQTIRSLERGISQFKPQLVMVMLYRNDLKAALQIAPMLESRGLHGLLRQHSRFYRLGSIVHGTWTRQVGRLPPLSAREIYRSLDRVQQLAGRSGVSIRFLILRDLWHEHIDISQELDRRDQSWFRAPPALFQQKLLIAGNGHWNADGHRAFAAWLQPLISQELMPVQRSNTPVMPRLAATGQAR
jgi:lysophospholipase L1-like esterase